MTRYQYVQIGIAAVLGNILILGADASLANSGDGDNVSQGLPGRRISGGTRHSENGFRLMQSADLSGANGTSVGSLASSINLTDDYN
ncbi:MAG: hypothetical protein AAGF01_03195 [Cyanobacteria bacterium P01_G01_bin.38]